jgi:hypothetical protein
VWQLIPIILATWEVEVEKIFFAQAKSPRDPISTNKSWVWWHTGHSNYLGSINGRTAVQVGGNINPRPYWKNN